jgi:RING finger protein 113A
MSTEDVKVPFFKKKGKGRPTTSRKRSASPGGDSSSGTTTVTAAGPISSAGGSSSKSEVVLPSRKAATNLLSAGTKRLVSQRDTLHDDANEDESRDGPDVKWTSAGSHIHAALEIIEGDEAEEMLARKRRKADGDDDEDDGVDDGLYRGQKGYQQHLKKSKEVPKAMRVGPQRASGSTIRTVTVVDYQPDVCKDYKGEYMSSWLNFCLFVRFKSLS